MKPETLNTPTTLKPLKDFGVENRVKQLKSRSTGAAAMVVNARSLNIGSDDDLADRDFDEHAPRPILRLWV